MAVVLNCFGLEMGQKFFHFGLKFSAVLPSTLKLDIGICDSSLKSTEYFTVLLAKGLWL